MDRIGWIDTAKGYGIIMVIIGHLSTPYITSIIYFFHMPLFFFISGFLFKEDSSFEIFIKKKIKRFLIPYLFLSTVIIVFNFIYINNSFSLIKNELISFLIQRRYTTLWFVTCLFIMNLISYLLKRFVKNDIVIFMIILGTCLGCIIYWRTKGNPLVWNVDISVISLPFFYCGYLISMLIKKKGFVFQFKSKYIILCLLIFILTGMVNYYFIGGKPDLFYSRIGVEPLFYLCAFSGIFVFLFISRMLDCKVASYIGKNSMIFFAWHMSIALPLVKLFYQYIGLHCHNSNLILYIYCRDFVTLILIILILYLFNECLLKLKMGFLLGK